jgi:hypothetical protein
MIFWLFLKLSPGLNSKNITYSNPKYDVVGAIHELPLRRGLNLKNMTTQIELLFFQRLITRDYQPW